MGTKKIFMKDFLFLCIFSEICGIIESASMLIVFKEMF